MHWLRIKRRYSTVKERRRTCSATIVALCALIIMSTFSGTTCNIEMYQCVMTPSWVSTWPAFFTCRVGSCVYATAHLLVREETREEKKRVGRGRKIERERVCVRERERKRAGGTVERGEKGCSPLHARCKKGGHNRNLGCVPNTTYCVLVGRAGMCASVYVCVCVGMNTCSSVYYLLTNHCRKLWNTHVDTCTQRSSYIHTNTHTRHKPQTEEIVLKTITTVKVSNKFSREPRTDQTCFHGSPQIFKQVVTLVNGVPVTQKIYQKNW